VALVATTAKMASTVHGPKVETLFLNVKAVVVVVAIFIVVVAFRVLTRSGFLPQLSLLITQHIFSFHAFIEASLKAAFLALPSHPSIQIFFALACQENFYFFPILKSKVIVYMSLDPSCGRLAVMG
jgi:hypothetical protein